MASGCGMEARAGEMPWSAVGESGTRVKLLDDSRSRFAKGQEYIELKCQYT